MDDFEGTPILGNLHIYIIYMYIYIYVYIYIYIHTIVHTFTINNWNSAGFFWGYIDKQ